jgi:hypothetical protein
MDDDYYDEHYDELREQILNIRDSGKVNMFDSPAVQREAYDKEFFMLVCFIEEYRRSYVNFILTGKFD